MPKELILIALFGGRFLYKYDECAFLGKMKKMQPFFGKDRKSCVF